MDSWRRRGQTTVSVPFFCVRAVAARIEIAMTSPIGFASLNGHKYLNLETFRKSGEGVSTPVWFVADPSASLDSGAAKLYVYTTGNAGKLKRIRNNGHVRVAPCDMRGKLLGEGIDAQAEIVTGEEADRGMRLLNQKYVPWKQLLDFFAMFRRRDRAVISIRAR
jgi:PPOX class probable F420-dependent enzyme